MEKIDISQFAIKDNQSITSDWIPLMKLINGVKLIEVKNVAKESGYLTEIYRNDWGFDNNVIDQVFQVALQPGGFSGWHVHKLTTDRLFVNHGLVKIALYDSRPDSESYGLVNEFRLGNLRPGLVVIPPGVWHAVGNLSSDISLLLNIVDKAYDYKKPDHYRLPIDTELIPYKFI